jgi:hypothetical protein
MELGLHSSACIFHGARLCYLYKQSFLLINYVSHTILSLFFFFTFPWPPPFRSGTRVGQRANMRGLHNSPLYGLKHSAYVNATGYQYSAYDTMTNLLFIMPPIVQYFLIYDLCLKKLTYGVTKPICSK